MEFCSQYNAIFMYNYRIHYSIFIIDVVLGLLNQCPKPQLLVRVRAGPRMGALVTVVLTHGGANLLELGTLTSSYSTFHHRFKLEIF